MHPSHTSLVRASWPEIAASLDTLTTSFYTCLFEIDSSAARLFAGVDMTLQRSRLAQTLAVIVRTLDDHDGLLPALAALGRRHATYGIEDRHFDAVGVALLRSLAITLGSPFTRDLHDAWSEAYSLIAAVMRRALLHASTSVVVNAVREARCRGDRQDGVLSTPACSSAQRVLDEPSQIELASA